MSKRKTARRPETPYKSKKQSAADAYAQRAMQHSEKGELNRAIKLIEQAITQAPNATLHRQLGQWLLLSKRPAKAVHHLERALEFNADFLPALIELGQEYTKQNNFDKARPLLEKAMPLSDENPVAHLVYGTFLQKQGELPEAVEHFRAALRFRLADPFKPAKPPARTDDFDKAETEALMWSTLSVLAKSEIHAFASYGTLLGLIREGSLLPFDKDIDFGLPHCEMERAAACLESNGWVESRNSFLTNPRAFFHPLNGITLDLSGFVVDKETGGTFTGFWMDNIPYEWARNTRYIDVNLRKSSSPAGEPIWELESPEAWLEAIYGDWRTPDPEFDTVVAAKNLCDFSLLTQSYAFARIYSKWEKGEIAKALALVRHAQHHLPTDQLLQDLASCLVNRAPKEGKSTETSPTENATHRQDTARLDSIDKSFGAIYENEAETLRFDS